MTSLPTARLRRIVASLALLGGAIATSYGLQAPREVHRFDALVIADPSVTARPAIRPISELEAQSLLAPNAPSLASAWKTFRADTSERWSVWLDTRSGAPALVQGEGIAWIPGSGNSLASVTAPTVDSLGASLRGFVHDHAELLVANDSELVLNREASVALTPELWQIVFDRVVDGVPVTGDGYVFHIGHGNLISFGAPRWSTVTASPVPTLDAAAAFGRLRTYLGLGKIEPIATYEFGTLAFTPMERPGTESEDFAGGTVGAGYSTVLTRKFAFGTASDAATWVGLVDAHTGRIVALYDDTKYAQVKGGVFPISNDGVPPDGVEQSNFPMPFATLVVNGAVVQSSSAGNFICTGGTVSLSPLAGPFLRVVDTCGSFTQSMACDNDLNLGTSSGTDCTVPAGASAANTHSARSSFYHLNRIKEHARGWLPANGWLQGQLVDNVNIINTCNAFWSPGSGTVNFYRSGGGCRNTGEIAGIFLHEWGHGLSQNDGLGSSNPDEAYADITSVLLTHNSCIGRGFSFSNCGGYGNSCLSCTGVRDMDYDKHATHVPQTPANWPGGCPSGSGPCGREAHCEAYLPGEVLWDLATRDMPAAGLDQATAWELVDRMWYMSRAGTSGNAYACSGTVGNSCASTAWMQQLRVLDDDDGNLANGTPHAAAIFAAFNRHAITCGAAGDAANQTTTSCPALATPVLTGSPGGNSASLSWPAVASAASYNILRNDQSCSYGHNLAANQPASPYVDSGLASGVPEYYSVQAVGSNTSCLSRLSNCVAVTPTISTADVAVSISDSPDPVVTESNITYTIGVSNNGPDTATVITLTGSVAASEAFVSLSAPGWSCSTPGVGASGSISCTLPSLASGVTSNLGLVVKVRGCQGNIMIGSDVSVASNTNDAVASNNTASTLTQVTESGTCSDGDVCTQTDFCSGTTCVGTNPITCTASDQCHDVGACDPGTGLCSNPPKTNGSACSDGNPCTNDTCQSGACTGVPLVCTPAPCHRPGTCDPGTGLCSTGSARPDGAACDDGNACTLGDLCQSGACVGGEPAQPPAEVNDSVTVAGAVIGWSDGAGAFNVYRGSRTAGASWAYDQTCLASSVPGPANDPATPAANGLFYYLVSRRDACGESVPGRDGGGTAIPNPTPCP